MTLRKDIYRAALAALLSVVAALPVPAQLRLNFSDGSPLRKLETAEAAINGFYVDSVDEERLVEDAIRGMLAELDPHSSYTTAKETRAVNEPLRGSFDGIGVQFNMVDDTLVVIQPVTGGPSERVGIVAGDRIVMVDDTVIAGVKMSTDEIMRRLRGPRGTTVDLLVMRRDIAGVIPFTVTRDRIPVTTIDAAYMIRPSVGYVRIGSFGATTYDEFTTAVDSLRAMGMESLIIDLQDNGGGYLHTAASIAETFLDDGDMIVYMEGRAVRRDEYYATSDGALRAMPLTVLINEYSASASEIFAGAMQDHDRALVVGRRSFGKGLVQRPIEFADGSMIRLTVAHYYTPSGRCIQKPYSKGAKADYYKDIQRRLERGELQSADSIHFADSLLFYTLKEHRPVYGGGGIMPDVFVALDTTLYTAFHRQAAARGIIIKVTLRYADTWRDDLLARYGTAERFAEEYDVPPSLIDDVVRESAAIDLRPSDDDELSRSIPRLSLQLKALVARDLWGSGEYYRVINEGNPIVTEALQRMLP